MPMYIQMSINLYYNMAGRGKPEMKKLFVYLKDYKKESVLAPLFKLLEAFFVLFVSGWGCVCWPWRWWGLSVR